MKFFSSRNTKQCKFLFPVVASVALALLSVSCKSTTVSSSAKSASAPSAVPPVEDDADTFTVGAGDTLSVAVWRQDDLSSTMPVDPDGMIHYPPGSFTKVSGMTIAQIQSCLTDALTNYVVAPKVSVGTVSIKSRRVHILGEVKNPGMLSLDSPMTVLDGVTSMGGFTLDAAQNRILLIRKEHGKLVLSSVYLTLDSADSKKFAPAINLRANDIVYVPPTHIADMARFLDHINTILTPIVSLERGIVLEPSVSDVLSGKSGSSSSGSGGSTQVILGQ